MEDPSGVWVILAVQNQRARDGQQIEIRPVHTRSKCHATNITTQLHILRKKRDLKYCVIYIFHARNHSTIGNVNGSLYFTRWKSNNFMPGIYTNITI